MDAKTEVPAFGQSPKQRKAPSRNLRYLCLGLAVSCLILESHVWRGRFALWRTSLAEVSAPPTWRWSKLKATSDIVWHSCYDDYDCAKLDVPLDWQDPSEDLRAEIAIIRYNATDRKAYGGPVFINPGGPGGSGVYYVKMLGPYYQSVVGRNYDIISFDPRGVGHSKPRIDCWGGSEQNARVWDLQRGPVLDAHPGVLYDAFASSIALSRQCASEIGGGEQAGNRFEEHAARKVAVAGPGRFVSTASTARDMLEIMEKLGETKLKYWGFSYGTVLAAIFPAMFPDKVGRIVSDGTVDVEEWISGAGTHFLMDADKIMEAFYQFCHSAGPAECLFYADSPGGIKSRLAALVARIRKYPVVVPALSGERPAIVTYTKVRRLLSQALYRPIITFPDLASALAALESGNGRPLLSLDILGVTDPFSCDSSEPGPVDDIPELPLTDGTADAFPAIMCSDADPFVFTTDEFQGYVDRLTALSSTLGPTMAQDFTLKCAGWTVRAKWRFTGPFAGNISHPILYVSNIADNVTPLRSARQNARGFPGSVILVQNSYGHTSLSTPSKCTAKVVRRYFQTGELPAEGTVCEPDLVPFEHFNYTVAKGGDNELVFALWKLMTGHVGDR